MGKCIGRGKEVAVIPSFRYRDNSVHLHECFWVGIFIILNKQNYHVYYLM